MMKEFLPAVILSVAACTITARAAETHPNILVILADGRSTPGARQQNDVPVNAAEKATAEGSKK